MKRGREPDIYNIYGNRSTKRSRGRGQYTELVNLSMVSATELYQEYINNPTDEQVISEINSRHIRLYGPTTKPVEAKLKDLLYKSTLGKLETYQAKSPEFNLSLKNKYHRAIYDPSRVRYFTSEHTNSNIIAVYTGTHPVPRVFIWPYGVVQNLIQARDNFLRTFPDKTELIKNGYLKAIVNILHDVQRMDAERFHDRSDEIMYLIVDLDPNIQTVGQLERLIYRYNNNHQRNNILQSIDSRRQELSLEWFPFYKSHSLIHPSMSDYFDCEVYETYLQSSYSNLPERVTPVEKQVLSEIFTKSLQECKET